MILSLSKNQRWLWILSLLFLFYFVAKAFFIPITHDESGSCLYFSSLPVRSILLYDNPWPTNHILNTLSVKLTTYLFGLNQFTGRLPNLITALLYLYFVVKITRLIAPDAIIALTVFLLFLGNPFLNDFFSLARGYGMSSAFIAGSIYFLLLLLREVTLKNFALTVLMGMLAVAANFSSLIYFSALNIVLVTICCYELQKKHISFNYFWKMIIMLMILDLFLAAFSYYPVTRMSATSQFQYWGSKGFYQETVTSLFHSSLYGAKYFRWHHIPVVILCLTILIAAVMFLGISILFRKNLSAQQKYFSISSLLLASAIGVNILQHKILGTPFLYGRTAILYLLLLAIMLATGFVLLHPYKKVLARAFSLSMIVFILVHLFNTVNLRYAREWWYDQNTFQVLDYLENVRAQRKTMEPIKLNTNWLFNPSFKFYKETRHLDWLQLTEYHKEPQFNFQDEFYYTVSDEYAIIPSGYNKIMNFDSDTRALFRVSGSPAEK